jgi:YVTN family beta-propeller protein
VHVNRHRRRSEGDRPGPLRRRKGSRTALVATGVTIALVAGAGLATGETWGLGTLQVGQTTDSGGLVVSSDQIISPYGGRLVINNGKIVSATISPDGTHLAASVADGGVALVIVDLANWKIQQVIGNSSSAGLKISSNSVAQAGPTYSPDGSQLWLGQPTGYTKFDVTPDGSLANPAFVSIPTQGTAEALASGAAFSADGSTVYAAVNGQNRVVAIDAASGTITQSWNVGIAPRNVVLVGSKLYVTNEGGRLAQPGDTTINSYGTQVPANPLTGATTTGTVSVIDTADPAAAVGSIDVGLHPTAVYAKDGAVFVTNTASNDVSVIDPAKDAVVQTISTQPWPWASVGYEPDGVALTDDGHLLVTLGRANAVAVYRFRGADQSAEYTGLLPTDYFPAGVFVHGDNVVIANTRGIDAQRPTTYPGHNTHDTTSSVNHYTLPSNAVIRSETDKVFVNNGWVGDPIKLSSSQDQQGQPVPVPVQLGAPSTIKHVFLIVKENRTYDQMFGDLPHGNGDSALTQFGENVTPNNHALAQQFGLYDNFYDTGTNSAEGHNWLMQADDPHYTETSAGEYIRSYDTEDDVLGHQRTGTIWSGAEAAGKTVRNFGEFLSYVTKPAGATWGNLYCDALNMDATGAGPAYPVSSGSPIPSLDSVSVHGFPRFDTSIPDIYRYEIWKQDFEKNGPANLNMLWLSSDHTGGPLNAAAQVADNDLALGKIVDTISHSKYWKNSAIFVVEDDSQAGLDHVDGHRAPVQVISPWARHGVVDDHYYSQITMVRTIEQILGIHPMNQLDTAATPMYGAFTDTPDYTPYTAVPNQTSLTLGYATQPSCGWNVPAAANPAFAAPPSATVPAAERAVAAQWAQWQSKQHLTGPNAIEDYANNVDMNHFTWYQAHGWTQPYPGESKIYAPQDVPGGSLTPSGGGD